MSNKSPALRKRIALAQMDIDQDHWKVLSEATRRAALKDADRVLDAIAREESRRAPSETEVAALINSIGGQSGAVILPATASMALQDVQRARWE